MMKTRILLLAALLLAPLAALAYDFSVDGIYYNITGEGTVEVTFGDSQYEGDVVVPASITVDGVEYAVTGIGDKAFYQVLTHSLKTLMLPEGLKYIGNMAISSIHEIDLPSTLEEIGYMAFAGSMLESIVLPEGLRSIGYDAFSGACFTKVFIPSTVEYIGAGAFSQLGYHHDDGTTYGLDSISVSPDNPYYDSREDCNAVIETATNTLVVGSNTTIIPSSVTALGSSAFCGVNRLEKLVLPAGIDTYAPYSITFCKNLKTFYVCREEPAGGMIFGPFLNFDFNNTVLYVPYGCEEAYRQSGSWYLFETIVGFDPAELTDIAGAVVPVSSTPAEIYDLGGRHQVNPHAGQLSISRGRKVVR